jgi:hypothetical protein
MGPDMFCNFYSVRNRKVDNNLMNMVGKEKCKRVFRIVGAFENFKMYVRINFKNNLILLNKICRRFIMTSKLFIGWNIPIDKSLMEPNMFR